MFAQVMHGTEQHLHILMGIAQNKIAVTVDNAAYLSAFVIMIDGLSLTTERLSTDGAVAILFAQHALEILDCDPVLLAAISLDIALDAFSILRPVFPGFYVSAFPAILAVVHPSL
jgi:hypothetical protein